MALFGKKKKPNKVIKKTIETADTLRNLHSNDLFLSNMSYYPVTVVIRYQPFTSVRVPGHSTLTKSNEELRLLWEKQQPKTKTKK